MKEFFKLGFIAVAMGTMYLFIELITRGYSYLPMAVLGGIAGALIGLLNKLFPWDTPLWFQGFMGMLIADTCEFTAGVYLNLILKNNMWDYSNLPFNLYGQICLYYSIAWFFVSILAILIDDFIRWKFFKEEKPRYKIF
ncbi:MAG: hypothetical protein ABRQ27_10850 [Clostridiaceae bacterium]